MVSILNPILYSDADLPRTPEDMQRLITKYCNKYPDLKTKVEEANKQGYFFTIIDVRGNRWTDEKGIVRLRYEITLTTPQGFELIHFEEWKKNK